MVALSNIITPLKTLTTSGGNMIGAINEATPVAVTVNSGVAAIAAANSNTVIINGSGPLTSFDVSTQGVTRRLLFNNAMTLTHGATGIQTANNVDISVNIGDIIEVMCLGLAVWKVVAKYP